MKVLFTFGVDKGTGSLTVSNPVITLTDSLVPKGVASAATIRFGFATIRAGVRISGGAVLVAGGDVTSPALLTLGIAQTGLVHESFSTYHRLTGSPTITFLGDDIGRQATGRAIIDITVLALTPANGPDTFKTGITTRVTQKAAFFLVRSTLTQWLSNPASIVITPAECVLRNNRQRHEKAERQHERNAPQCP